MLELIHEVRKDKPVGEPTRLAWGAGITSRLVAKRLSELLEKEEVYPSLTLHALTSGFLVDEPMTAPMPSHGFFDADRFPIHSVGLFSEAVVKCKDYKDLKKAFGVKRRSSWPNRLRSSSARSPRATTNTACSIASCATPLRRPGGLREAAPPPQRPRLVRRRAVLCRSRPTARSRWTVTASGLVTLFELSELVQRRSQRPQPARPPVGAVRRVRPHADQVR